MSSRVQSEDTAAAAETVHQRNTNGSDVTYNTEPAKTKKIYLATVNVV